MEKKFVSHNELKEFIHYHSLSDKNSIIHFRAFVDISTADNNIIDEELDVSVTFGGYGPGNLGRLIFINTELEATVFPIEYFAVYQTILFMDDKRLKIEGKHPNPKIGDYSTIIKPIN